VLKIKVKNNRPWEFVKEKEQNKSKRIRRLSTSPNEQLPYITKKNALNGGFGKR